MLNPFDAGSKEAQMWIHLLTESTGRIARRKVQSTL
jgi:hypothetical protein